MRRLGLTLGIAAVFGFCLEATTSAGAQSDTERQISHTAQSLLMAGKFDQLESTATRLRNSETRVSGGTPEIAIFYDALGAIRGGCTCAQTEGEASFEAKRAAIAKWLETHPKSITPRLAMAQLWISYALLGRGVAYADDTSDEQWKRYFGRLRAALEYVHGFDPRHDLFAYYERMSLIEVLPPSRQTLDAAYTAGVSTDPTYFPLYERKAWMLQEKWYGQPGELAQFTQSLLHAPGGETGEIAYATVASEFYKVFAGYHAYQKVGVSWPVLKSAYELKERRYGLSQQDWDAMMGYSGIAADVDFASEQIAGARARANAGSVVDQENLARTYSNGFGVAPDFGQAVYWYQLAAAKGDLRAQFNLGSIYEHASPPDYQTAMRWYELAAAQGDAIATNNIAYMYENGKGVSQDYGKAAALYLQAANKDAPRAEYHLGTLYDRGLGVPKNRYQAIAWMVKAAQSGDKSAEEWLQAHARKF